MRLSLYGLMNVRPDVLDELHIPSDVDRKTLTDLLYLKSWDLELVYPFPDFLKEMIGSWSAAHLWQWQKLVDTTKLVYNPIWNKDGVVFEKEIRDLTGEQGGSGTSGNSSEDVTSTNAFNGGAYTDREKGEASSSGSWGENRNAKEKEAMERVKEEHGNIGVTSTQQMIREEREISDFSIYETIAEQFVKAFCIEVY